MEAVNHEYNNVQGVVSASLGLLALRLQDHPALLQLVEEADTDAKRGKFITQAASKYRKDDATPVQAWALRRTFDEALKDVEEEPFAGATPTLTITNVLEESLTLEGRGTIPELFKNVLRCLGWACDQRSGTLTVSASQEPEAITLRVVQEGGVDLQAEIEKTGVELAPEPGRHGGLYFFLIKRIVVDHAGSLRVERTPGGGTTFVIRLPRTPRPST